MTGYETFRLREQIFRNFNGEFQFRNCLTSTQLKALNCSPHVSIHRAKSAGCRRRNDVALLQSEVWPWSAWCHSIAAIPLGASRRARVSAASLLYKLPILARARAGDPEPA